MSPRDESKETRCDCKSMTSDIKANSVERHRGEEPEIEILECSLVCPSRGILQIEGGRKKKTTDHVIARSNPDDATAVHYREKNSPFDSISSFIKAWHVVHGGEAS